MLSTKTNLIISAILVAGLAIFFFPKSYTYIENEYRAKTQCVGFTAYWPYHDKQKENIFISKGGFPVPAIQILKSDGVTATCYGWLYNRPEPQSRFTDEENAARIERMSPQFRYRDQNPNPVIEL